MLEALFSMRGKVCVVHTFDSYAFDTIDQIPGDEDIVPSGV